METIVIVAVAVIVLFVIFKIFKTLLKWLLLGVVAALAIAFLSNPDESDHKKGLKELARDLPVKIKDNAISVDDYKILSIAKVKVDGKEKIAGIGAFGKVWYFDDLKDHFK
jgi:hypothetical protein